MCLQAVKNLRKPLTKGHHASKEKIDSDSLNATHNTNKLETLSNSYGVRKRTRSETKVPACNHFLLQSIFAYLILFLYQFNFR